MFLLIDRHRAAVAIIAGMIDVRATQSNKPFVVGAVVDLGFCLDLISTNGIKAVDQAHKGLVAAALASDYKLRVIQGGDDWLLRRLDGAVIAYLHAPR